MLRKQKNSKLKPFYSVSSNSFPKTFTPMRFSAIPATEADFRKTGNPGGFSFTTVDVPVPGEDLRLKALFAKPANRSKYFHAVEHSKKRIVLHFTAGNLKGDMTTLTRHDFHVSVAFVIARDGTIYQLFPSKFWSGHIGPGIGNAGMNNAQDKCTIGIEISNYGVLHERDGNLETIYSRQKNPNTGQIGPVDVYCSLNDRLAYQKTDAPFRAEQFFPTYTDEQYESLIVLLRYLTAAWKIPRVFLPEATRYKTDEAILTFNGIVSHVNYRSSGKWDIGPAFDWERVIEGVQAAAFVPTIQRTPMLAGESEAEMELEGAGAVTSEDDLIPLLPEARDAALENDPYGDAGEQVVEPPKNRTVYALLVGINAYQEDLILDRGVMFPALRGCVADADKMEQYLKEQKGIEPIIKRLTDKNATKAAIVGQIREHLGKASPDDTVLFYFSGHGTQEKADPAWDEETDGKLECLACHYDAQTANDFLLADKELRYLIHELWADKQPHIVTLFDCCHSGDNTRAVEVSTAAFPDQKPVAKAIPYVFSQRDWSKFVFADTIALDQLKADKMAQLFPEGVHVQMAACEAHESAVEVGGEGVFTKVLVNTLRGTAGSITYHDLQSRVRAYLRNVYEQKPRFRVAGGSSGMLYRTFLGGSELQEAGLVGTIVHTKAGWSLDKGAIQGIGKAHDTIQGVGNDRIVRFRVHSIFPDYTTLQPAADSPNPANPNTVYKAHISGLMAQKIRVGFELEDINGTEQDDLLNRVTQKMADELIVVNDADETPALATRKADTPNTSDKADYVVRGRKGKYYLTYPIRNADPDDSMAYRPLVMPIESDTDNAVSILTSHLRHVARWEYIRQLENQSPGNRLQREPLSIEIWRKKPDGNDEQLTLKDSSLPLDFWSFEGQDADGKPQTVWTCPLRVRITNNSPVKLYVSALYLTMGFASYLSLLPDEVYTLEKGQSVELTYKGHAFIPFQMSQTTPLYNWPERVEYFKFIASTSLYDAAEMQLEALPEPPVIEVNRGADRDVPRMGQIAFVEPAVQGWNTQRIDLHWNNPTYNQIEPTTIEAMLNDEALADFALGLYYENKTDEEKPAIQLKEVLRDLTANVPLREKGLLGDLGLKAANSIARFRRNQRYKKAMKRNPNQFHIVSEGDSWFQHPLVTDTIDHLAASYPVFCVAAAGDTLRNMTMASEGTPPVEEYIKAIQEQHPDVFVLSGGGNDILGEQFRRYLKANVVPTPNTKPADYLEGLLNADLNALQAMYREIFTKLKTDSTNPKLKVLVHGYDYIIPLKKLNKGWLGRYMIEKGIGGSADDPQGHQLRKEILKHILTEFNARMKAVAEEFKDFVSYIETPGTVADDQWYDEIHPNSEGFALVAAKFKKRIDELMAS